MPMTMIPRTVTRASLSVLLLACACQVDGTPTSAEPVEQGHADQAVHAAANPQSGSSTTHDEERTQHAHRVAALLPPGNQVARQGAPLIRYRSPIEAGTHHAAKEKGGEKAFVASPPEATPPKITGDEHRRRIDRYLAKLEQQKGKLGSLKPDDQEAAKDQLKTRALGGEP